MEKEPTHILTTDFGAAFLQALLDVLLLIALVIAQTSDEVVERLFEPAAGISACPPIPEPFIVAPGLVVDRVVGCPYMLGGPRDPTRGGLDEGEVRRRGVAEGLGAQDVGLLGSGMPGIVMLARGR